MKKLSPEVEAADKLIVQWQRGELGRGEFVNSLREVLCSPPDPGAAFISKRIARDEFVVGLCADKLAEHGHHHAANSLRKMAREGEIL